MADLKQIRYQRPDLSYADDLRTYADASSNLVTALPAAAKRRLVDALGRVIAEIDEATGDITRTRHSDGAEGPRHTLVHETASPAADDVLGRFAFRARNDAGALYTGVEFRALVKNAAAGSEEVWFEAGLMNGGAFVPAGLSLRIVGGAVKLFIDGVEAGTGGGGGPSAFSGARVTNDTNISVSGTGPIGDPLAFSIERFDTDDYHSTASNPSRLTAPNDGYYLIGAHVQWSSTGTGARLLTLQKDGTSAIVKQGLGSIGGTDDRMMSVQTVTFLSTGQFVEVFARQTSGGAVNAEVGADWTPDFWIVRLGF